MPKSEMRSGEFVALAALVMSLTALSIDAMMSAMPIIGQDVGVVNLNDNQLILSSLFLGLAIGQLVYGPISDSTGRKPPIYAGLLIFVVGCLVSIYATSFEVMLVGRVLQGIGVAGPRTVIVALIRDKYSGADMARIMSFIMAVFIIGPVIAPTLGQIVLLAFNWQMIFVCLALIAVITMLWFGLRQIETLPPSKRTTLSSKRIVSSIFETCTNREALGYTVAAGLIFSVFIAYLSTAQQIFQVHFGLGEMFPIYFGSLALTIGVTSVYNGKIVKRLGMHLLIKRSLQLTFLFSAIFLVGDLISDDGLPFWYFMTWGLCTFSCMGFLFGNVNALAMEHVGHIAGTAASVIGSLTTVISLTIGTIIGQYYNDTVFPLICGFMVMAIVTLVLTNWLAKYKTKHESL